MKEISMTQQLHPKILQINYDQLGVSETFFEPKSNLLFYILCDAINLSNPEKNLYIAREFEKIIKEYIHLHWTELTEKVLKKALEHAQNHFLKHYLAFENQLKIAITIIAEERKNIASETRHLLIAGAGDVKVYQLDRTLQLIFYDPEIPQLPENLSIKKRFHYITNAIGTSNFKGSITTAQLKPDSSLLIATYGAYNKVTKVKLFSLFSNIDQKKSQIYKLLTKSKDKDHMSFFSHISFKSKMLPYTHDTPVKPSPLHHTLFSESKKEKHFPVWILKIASVAIVSLLCLEFFNYYINLTKTTPYHLLVDEEPKSVQTSIDLKSLKKPLELPFIKERAYIVDLKEKYEQQSQVIEKLQSIVNEQDKALRDLQVKNFFQNDTISAKSYRPKEEDLSSNN